MSAAKTSLLIVSRSPRLKHSYIFSTACIAVVSVAANWAPFWIDALGVGATAPGRVYDAGAGAVQGLVGSKLERDPVLVAPVPALARLDRAHDRVPRRVVVRGRVLVRRVVAAADLA